MKITLFDVNPSILESARHVGLGSICDLQCCDFRQLNADAIVSPANAFGFMDGGIDLAYSRFFGWGLQKRLQETIRADYEGELLVGQAIVVSTENEQFPYLVSAPAMRVPSSTGPDNPAVFLAVRAAIRSAMKYKDIDHIAIPGMGTGCGGCDHIIAMKSIREAILEALHGSEFPKDIGAAISRQTGFACR